jgi:hypothetical protein
VPPAVAGLRFCADKKPSARIVDCARMKSTSARNRRSWIKATRVILGFIHNRVFCADAFFIRAENAVGARSAQVLSYSTAFKFLNVR